MYKYIIYLYSYTLFKKLFLDCLHRITKKTIRAENNSAEIKYAAFLIDSYSFFWPTFF